MNKIPKLKVSVILIIFLSMGIVIWGDSEYSIMNQARANYGLNSVILYEDTVDKLSWGIEEPIRNEVYVRNGEVNDNPSFNYDDAYVRIKFSEFLGFMDTEKDFTSDRYLIDSEGNFVKGITKDIALGEARKLESSIKSEQIVRVKTKYDPGSVPNGYWYVKTNETTSVNGIYGKMIDLGPITKSTVTSMINKDVVMQVADLDKEEVQISSAFTKRMLNFKNSSIAEYVQINLGEDVITYDDWIKDSNGHQVNKWIIDTNSEQGWVYWGGKLIHSVDPGSDYLSKTSSLVDTVELIQVDSNPLVYRLRANMDAVSKDSLDTWNDAPKPLIDAYKANKLDWTVLNNSISKANAKLNRLTLVGRYKNGVIDALKNTIKYGTDMKEGSNVSITQSMINNAAKNIDEAVKALKLDLNYTGELAVNTKITNFGGKNWTVLYINEDNYALIVGDTYTKAELEAIGTPKEYYTNDLVYFNSSKKEYKGGYPNSYLNTINNLYYQKYIKGRKEELFFARVNVVLEQPKTQLATEDEIFGRMDGLSEINGTLGSKVLFTMSISEWNKYYDRKLINQLLGPGKIWTRTPYTEDVEGNVTGIISTTE